MDSKETRHRARVAMDLAFGDAVGPCLMVGSMPPEVARGAAASATGLALFGSAAELFDDLENQGPAWVEAFDLENGDLEGFPDPFGSVVLWDPPAPVSATLESALGRVADDGVVHFVKPVVDRGVAKRWLRLIEASCQPGVTDASDGEDRLVVRGVRRRLDAPGRTLVSEDPLPMSMVVVVEGRCLATERVLLDVLLRQNYPAAEVFVVDVGGPGGPVPDDVFGFAASPPPRVVLVPSGDLPAPEAVNDVLGAVSEPFVGIIAPGQRLAPNHHAAKGMMLERRDDLAAVVAPGGGAGGLVLKTAAVRELRGLDPSRGGDAVADLMSRISPARLGVHVLPVAARAQDVE